MAPPPASSTNCVMCELPAFQRASDDHRRIADLEVSTAILASREQFYLGYPLLALNHHAEELFDLDQALPPAIRRRR